MSKYLDLKNNYNKDLLIEAAKYIKDGKLVLFPTETVYGIGADGLNEEAVKNIFIAKGRAQDNPLILHVSSLEMIERLAKNISTIEYKLIETFFPGPLTIVLNKKEIVPNIVSANLDTVGIRMPENIIARDLIELSNRPIAAPSANISGKPSGTNIEDIFDELHDKVDYIIDGGPCQIGLESTVVRVINNEIHILRPGKITANDLNKIAPTIIDSHVLNEVKKYEIVMSPGMKYKHYAPLTQCLLIYSNNKNTLINKLKKYDNEDNLIITNEENLNHFKNSISYGSSLEDISHNIFNILRKVDKLNKKLIIIEGVKSEGLGLAIMNRLIRACAHNYIEL